MWLVRLLLKGGFATLVLFAIASLDFNQVGNKTNEVVQQVDRQYRGFSQAANWVGESSKAIASFFGVTVDATKQVFSLDFSDPLVTGLTTQGYHVFVCDPDNPLEFCRIRYPQPIVWTAPLDGVVVADKSYVAYTTAQLPGYRFLFEEVDPIGSGEVKQGQVLVSSQQGEILMAVQQRNADGTWENVPPGRGVLYMLIQGGR